MKPEPSSLPSIRQALVNATSVLSQLAESEPRLEADLLLAFALKKSRSHLFAWPEKQLNKTQSETFSQLIERRCNGEPIAYITGVREFWSLELTVSPDTLIPRPETELLVARALEHLPVNQQQTMADLGTGSGAIAIAIASERPLTRVIACDHSKEALAVAQKNIASHRINNITTAQGDWFQALPKATRFNLIASNPPYVAINDPHLERSGLPWEPNSALISGADGLDDIRILTKNAQQHLTPGGWLLIEHGYDQGPLVCELMVEAGFKLSCTLQDLEGRDRLTEAMCPTEDKCQ